MKRSDGERIRIEHLIASMRGMLNALEAGMRQPGAISNEAQGLAQNAMLVVSHAGRLDAYEIAERLVSEAASREVTRALEVDEPEETIECSSSHPCGPCEHPIDVRIHGGEFDVDRCGKCYESVVPPPVLFPSVTEEAARAERERAALARAAERQERARVNRTEATARTQAEELERLKRLDAAAANYRRPDPPKCGGGCTRGGEGPGCGQRGCPDGSDRSR